MSIAGCPLRVGGKGLASEPRSAHVLEWARALVGAHFGIIEELESVPCEPDDVPLFVYAGRLCRTSAFHSADAPRTVSGAALDVSNALAACLGEAVERYAGALAAPGAVVHTSLNALQGEWVVPTQFALFSSRQYRQSRHHFPFEGWRIDHSLGWMAARRLPSNDAVWVPAAFVRQPYCPAEGEPLIAPTLSTGLAAGADEVAATLGGLCEVIERDAVALSWLGKVVPPRIEIDARIDAGVAELSGQLAGRGFRWAAFDLTTDLGVPVAAVLIEGNSSIGPVISFGSACHLNRGRALHKALVEAAHCRMYVKSLWREQPDWQAGGRCENVTSFAGHARYYTSQPERRGALDRWWHAPRSVRWNTLSREESLAQLLQRLSAAGHDVLSIDLTPPDIAPLGLRVVRVLAPGLQPLHGNHHWPHLGGPRLRRLQRVFGPCVRSPWRWNSDPHPCP